MRRKTSVRRILKLAAFGGALLIVALVVRIYLFPYTQRLEETTSPDGHWLAASTDTEYPSIFTAADETVVLRRAGFWHLWGEEKKVVEFSSNTGAERILGLRWIDPRTLEVTMTDAARDFEVREDRVEDVAIRYKTAPTPRTP